MGLQHRDGLEMGGLGLQRGDAVCNARRPFFIGGVPRSQASFEGMCRARRPGPFLLLSRPEVFRYLQA